MLSDSALRGPSSLAIPLAHKHDLCPIGGSASPCPICGLPANPAKARVASFTAAS